ncbi:MAG: LuxR C-terminal-related transcriptional regulator [Ghiorsea sp.]|nr:LuxR C-terminal-related transcriptional regulator [Ghiorsea sp.]
MDDLNRETSQSLIEVSELIALIYDTSPTHEQWPKLLKAMNHYLQQFDNSDAPNNLLTEQANQLSLHLHQSFQISQAADKKQQQLYISSQLLDQLPIGVIVTNAQAEIVALNQQAKESISAHAAISIQNNVLHTSAHQTTALLHQHIQQISSGETTEKGISLPLTNNSNPSSLSIWITAMSAIEATESYEQGLVSIYIVSSFIKPQYDAIILQKHFGLTAAETTLAKTLTNGCHSLVEAAAHLKVSTHTVRSHMKSIFSKTGCSSQVELVKMILTSPAILKQSADHLPPSINSASPLYHPF